MFNIFAVISVNLRIFKYTNSFFLSSNLAHFILELRHTLEHFTVWVKSFYISNLVFIKTHNARKIRINNGINRLFKLSIKVRKLTSNIFTKNIKLNNTIAYTIFKILITSITKFSSIKHNFAKLISNKCLFDIMFKNKSLGLLSSIRRSRKIFIILLFTTKTVYVLIKLSLICFFYILSKSNSIVNRQLTHHVMFKYSISRFTIKRIFSNTSVNLSLQRRKDFVNSLGRYIPTIVNIIQTSNKVAQIFKKNRVGSIFFYNFYNIRRVVKPCSSTNLPIKDVFISTRIIFKSFENRKSFVKLIFCINKSISYFC